MICEKCGTNYSSIAGKCPKCENEKKASQYAANSYNKMNGAKPATPTIGGRPVAKPYLGDKISYTSNAKSLVAVLGVAFFFQIVGLIATVIWAFVLISKDVVGIGVSMLVIGGGIQLFGLWLTSKMVGFLEDFQSFVGDVRRKVNF